MTNEKAIKVLDGMLNLIHQTNICFDDVMDYRSAKALANNALLFRIPKKPIVIKTKMYTFYRCATCNGYIALEMGYCPKCGQAIDWSEEE